jgi:hypothetical protein
MIDFEYFSYGTGLVLLGYCCGIAFSMAKEALRIGSGGSL